MKLCVLVVEDNMATGEALVELLQTLQYHGRHVKSAEEALEVVESEDIDIILADLNLPGKNGLWLVEQSVSRHRLPIIMITGNATVDTAVEAIKKGAHDYLSKPVDLKRLEAVLTSAARLRTLALQNELLAKGDGRGDPLGNMVGKSPAMNRLKEMIARVAKSDASVLILGESGTGKELVAGAVVALSPRANHPYIRLNSAALPKDTLESELFGHVKGAFTGAIKDRRGKFELAHEGSLFLDEIGDMSLDTQSKLLRVLQEGEFERMGGSEVISVDVRIITATNRDLREMVEQRHFREDLYFRLNVVPIEVPPLRQRKGDISMMAESFLKHYCGKEPKYLSREALAALESYPWPGNVRELKNIMERLSIIVLTERIEPGDLPAEISSGGGKATLGGAALRRGTIEDMEREAIFKALRDHQGVKSEVARQLGIGLKTLYRKLDKYQEEGYDLRTLTGGTGGGV